MAGARYTGSFSIIRTIIDLIKVLTSFLADVTYVLLTYINIRSLCSSLGSSYIKQGYQRTDH